MEMNYGATTNNNTKVDGAVVSAGSAAGSGDHHPAAADVLGRPTGRHDLGTTTRANASSESDSTTPSPVGSGSDSEKTRNRLDTVCIVGYCVGLVTFVCFYHVKGFPRFPYPAIGNLQDIDPNLIVLDLWEEGAILVLVTWGIRYIRKMGMLLLDQWFFRAHLSETAATAGLSGRLGRSPGFGPITPSSAASANCTWYYLIPTLLYHGGFGVWMGLATNYNLAYQISDMEWIIAGLAIFLIGELVIICRTVWAARQARHSTDPVFVGSLPTPVVEIAEVISCVGYAFLTLTLPACIMAFIRLIIAILAAVAKKIHGPAF